MYDLINKYWTHRLWRLHNRSDKYVEGINEYINELFKHEWNEYGLINYINDHDNIMDIRMMYVYNNMVYEFDRMLEREIIKRNIKFIYQICKLDDFNIYLVNPDLIKKLNAYSNDLYLGLNIAIIDSNYEYHNGRTHKKTSSISLSYIKGYVGHTGQLLIYLLSISLSLYNMGIFDINNNIMVYILRYNMWY